MAKGGKTGPEVPEELAQVPPPRDLYATSDIRFVMLEIGKLTAKVDRLIDDVKSQSEKVDALRHQATFIKGLIAASTVWVTIIIALASFVLSSKWDAVIAALRAASK